MKSAYLTFGGKTEIINAAVVQDLNCGIQSVAYTNNDGDTINVETGENTKIQNRAASTCALTQSTDDYFKEWSNVTENYVELDEDIVLPVDSDMKKYATVTVGSLIFRLDDDLPDRNCYKVNRTANPIRLFFKQARRGDYISLVVRRR